MKGEIVWKCRLRID